MSPQNHSPNPPNDFESVELEELDKGVQQKEKAPRRIIHFSSGETMEEYSTDEEEDGEEKEQERKDLLSSPVDAVRVRTSERTVDLITEKRCRLFLFLSNCYIWFVLQSKMTWGPYFWFHMWRAATSTISGLCSNIYFTYALLNSLGHFWLHIYLELHMSS